MRWCRNRVSGSWHARSLKGEPERFYIGCGAQKGHPPLGALILPRLPAGGMVNVKDFNRIVSDLVKELVRISNQRNAANASTLLNFPRTLRPSPDALFYCAKAL